jgi:hypothetical protein
MEVAAPGHHEGPATATAAHLPGIGGQRVQQAGDQGGGQ